MMGSPRLITHDVPLKPTIQITGPAVRRDRSSLELYQPRVTVVIPCYKQAQFLGEAIESVLAQTVQDFEIIVVDDGSPDNTSEVASGYAGVRLIRQPNLGLSAARNAGLRKSRGEYIVFLDADDVLLPEALAFGVEAMASHPECAFVAGTFNYVDLDRRKIGSGREHPAAEEPYLELLKVNHIAMHATVMLRREVLTAVGGYDTSLRTCEDYDVHLRIARIHPVHYHNNVISEYRQHDSNESKHASRMLKGALVVLRKQWPYVKGRRDLEQAYRTGVKFWQTFYGEKVIQKIRTDIKTGGKRSEIFRDAVVLLRYHPRGFILHAYRKVKCILRGV